MAFNIIRRLDVERENVGGEGMGMGNGEWGWEWEANTYIKNIQYSEGT